MKREIRLFTIFSVLLASGATFAHATPVRAHLTVTEIEVSPEVDIPNLARADESPMAVDPQNPAIAITGANDPSHFPICIPPTGGPTTCPVPPVDWTGVYWTKDGGATWQQEILPWLSYLGLPSFGDSSVTFGPKPDSNGKFAWSNGVRAYFGSLDTTFTSLNGGVAESFSDDCADATVSTCTWSAPVLANNKDNPVDFNDKDAIYADQNSASPYFGNLYVSWTFYKGQEKVGLPEPIMISRSVDGGKTFEAPRQLTPSADNARVGGRQGSTIRTDKYGNVYVFWEGASSGFNAILGALSKDGGATFGRPFIVSTVFDIPNPFPGASFRTNSFPMADIDSSGNLYVVWTDEFTAPTTTTAGHSKVKLAKSTNAGTSWMVRVAADVTANPTGTTSRSAFYPAVAVHGNNVFIGFNAIDDVPGNTAPGAGVVKYDSYYVLSTDSGASFGTPAKISAVSSDPDVSSCCTLTGTFLGDYNGAAAGSDGSFWFAWTDTRNGVTCPAVDAYRAGTGPHPNIFDSCPAQASGFNDTDIYVGIVKP